MNPDRLPSESYIAASREESRRNLARIEAITADEAAQTRAAVEEGAATIARLTKIEAGSAPVRTKIQSRR